MRKRMGAISALFVGGVLFASGFAAAFVWDLPLNIHLYNPKNVFAIAMEAAGLFPFLFFLFYCTLRITRPKPLQKRQDSLFFVLLLLVGFVGMFYYFYSIFVKRGLLTGLTDATAWLWLAAALALTLTQVAFCFRMPLNLRPKLEFWALCGILYLTINLAVVNLLKLFWQRTRFDDMVAGGSFADFTPWFQPLANGGNSFPSGHTANAASIFMLLVLCDLFASNKKIRSLTYVVCWGCITAMGLGRMIIGRHFLSDTLAASGIMALLFMVLRRARPYTDRIQYFTQQKHSLPEES